MKMYDKLSILLAVLATSGCMSGIVGSDWRYSESADPINGTRQSFAVMSLFGADFSDQPSYLAASCTDDGFDFWVESKGYWGGPSRYFRRNQTFEIRVGTTIFRGRYLPSSTGQSAYLISDSPKYQAVNTVEFLYSFAGAESVAVRVADYQGTTSTVTRFIGGDNSNLLKVAQDCNKL